MELIFPFLTIVLFLLFGFIVSDIFKKETSSGSSLFYSICLGICLSTALCYFLSILFNLLWGIIISQTLISIGCFYYLIKYKKRFNQILITPFLNLYNQKLLILALLITLVPLLFVFHNHILSSDNEGNLYTGESTYGDLPFHLAAISSMAYTDNFPPLNTFFAGYPLVYPYLINFFSAILVLEGLSLRDAIIIPGLLLSAGLVGVLFDLGYRVTKKDVPSFLTVLFFFFNGGLGFYYFLKDNAFDIDNIFNRLITLDIPKEYSHLFEQNIHWGNFITRMIVPERSLLFGLPIGIIILSWLFFGNDEKIDFKKIIIISVLLSLMPLLHTHTVLVFAVVLPILALYSLFKGPVIKKLRTYLITTVLTILFTLPHFNLFLGHVSESESFMRFHFGWMTKEESIFFFWFKNTYLYIPFALLVLLIPKVFTSQLKVLVSCGLILLILVNLILFSPFDWDNVKFLFWVGIFFSMASAAVIGCLLSSKNWVVKVFTLIIIFTMVSSALLSLIRELKIKYVLFSKEAVALGQAIKDQTPTNSIFLTYPLHNSPVNNLAGRSILMGYPGLLWTQGISYTKREQDIREIYQGNPNFYSLTTGYGLDYIVVESYNPEGFGINKYFFNQFPLIFQSPNYKIYKISKQ